MEKEIILRAQEVNEILTSTPKWVLRWGIFVVFILILTSIALSYFIRYPDIITADITLITINQPITCFAKNNGKLAYLLVKNNDLVNKNQIIAIIENTSKYEDVLYLYESLKIWDENPHRIRPIFVQNSNPTSLIPVIYNAFCIVNNDGC